MISALILTLLAVIATGVGCGLLGFGMALGRLRPAHTGLMCLVLALCLFGASFTVS